VRLRAAAPLPASAEPPSQRFDEDAATPFHTARLKLAAVRVRRYKDNDLVLLSRLDPQQEVSAAAAANRDDEVHALALVEQTEADNTLRLRLHLPVAGGGSGLGLGPPGAAPASLLAKQAARFAAVRGALAVRDDQQVHLLRLCNLSTIQREWLGLHASRGLPFQDVILSATERPGAQRHWRCPSALDAALAAKFNASQRAAIGAGLENSPLVLIQGPPGTGKTATLQALLSLIMHAVPAALGSSGARAWPAEPSGGGRAGAPGERLAAWRASAPWLFGARNPRDAGPDVGAGMPLLAPPAPPRRLGFSTTRNPHVLVCAPSNSALDEIVLRLLQDGLLDATGVRYTPTLVRVGVHPHASVREVTMDALVDARLTATQRSARAAALAPVAGDVASSGRARGAPPPSPAARPPGEGALLPLPAEEPLSSGSESDDARELRRRPLVGTPLERDRARLAILDECAIVASTLSFSGSGLFARMARSFDVVIIDEAAQAVEPSVLVPLAYGCRQLFLVGDPIQLPATVLSDAAKARGYDTSLFKRLQTAGHGVHVLRTQYRMHPEIRSFPSAEFYAEALEDGPGVALATHRAWHAHPALGPFTFWDVRGREKRPAAGGASSWANAAEARLVLALARAFLAAAPALGARHDGLAVVTPYRGQVAIIRQLLQQALGDDAASRIDVNTIDGFQGREREVVLFSVVRSPRPGAPRAGRPHAPRIGFVADERRMNVGLTRARAALVVVGNAAALQGDPHWGSLVEDARARGRLVTAREERAASFAAQIEALGELPEGAPLQAAAEEEEEGGAWEPQPEERAMGDDPEEYSGQWVYGDGRDGDDEAGGEDDDAAYDGAAEAVAAARAAKRPRKGLQK